jgi:LysW-gamma-L-lysine carboxypeptidase
VSAWVGEFNKSRNRVFDQVTLALQNFSSGETGFENWASLRIGARLPVDLPPAAWYAQLQSLAGTAAVQPLGYAIPAYAGEKNNPLVRGMLAGIRAQGGQPGFLLKSGTADLNIVAPAWGCPALAYGPGDSALDHTPDEHLALEEYARAVEVLATALQRLYSLR